MKNNSSVKLYKICVKKYIYKFENSELLMLAMKELYSKNREKCSLYLYQKNYYLITLKKLEIKNSKSIKNIYLTSVLEEYGKLLSNDAINEIGSLIKDS